MRRRRHRSSSVRRARSSRRTETRRNGRTPTATPYATTSPASWSATSGRTAMRCRPSPPTRSRVSSRRRERRTASRSPTSTCPSALRRAPAIGQGRSGETPGCRCVRRRVLVVRRQARAALRGLLPARGREREQAPKEATLRQGVAGADMRVLHHARVARVRVRVKGVGK